MCGRFTNKLTWTEIVALYRLTMDRPPHNMRADYNVCPTDPVDTVVEHDGQRDLVQMGHGLIRNERSKSILQVSSSVAGEQQLVTNYFKALETAAKPIVVPRI
jgi:putative SOS response-associated peptidase YedK